MTTTKITPEMLAELETCLNFRERSGSMDHPEAIYSYWFNDGEHTIRVSTLRALLEEARLLQELRDAYAPLNSGEYVPAAEYNELARQFDAVLDKVLGS